MGAEGSFRAASGEMDQARRAPSLVARAHPSDCGLPAKSQALSGSLPGSCLWVTGQGGLGMNLLASPHPFSPCHPLPTSLPQAAEEDIPKQKERTHFTVRLTEAKPVDKVKLIKEIKNYVQGINLVQVRFHVPHNPLPPSLTALRLAQAQVGF